MTEFKHIDDHISAIENYYIEMLPIFKNGASVKEMFKKIDLLKNVEIANAFIDILKINFCIKEITPASLFNAGLLEVEADRLMYYYNIHNLYKELVELIRDKVFYSDLIKINPSNYGITKDELEFLIANAISEEYAMQVTKYHLNSFPSVKMIAKDMQAPYSVVMKAFRIANPY